MQRTNVQHNVEELSKSFCLIAEAFNEQLEKKMTITLSKRKLFK
ncbi:hypothetical protein SAMN05443253_102155 [Bacillus sp. OK048]|nr:hypothetical protein SAMN05443253_102155 [Bacillus sp. OK048]